MASLVTGKYTVGNQADYIRSAFMSRGVEQAALRGGVHPALARGMGQAAVPSTPPATYSTTTVAPAGSGWLSQIIDPISQFVTARWGQQRGTITILPDGTMVQKQTAGAPIQTQAPIVVGGAMPGINPMAQSIGMGSSGLLLLGGGALLLMLVMKGSGRKG